MRCSSWLILATMAMGLAGVARAAPPMDPAIEARFKALEQRIAELEQRLGEANARAAAAAAAPAPAPAVVAPAGTIVVGGPSAPRPADAGHWKDPGVWSQLRRGMSWSQVSKILGTPGAKTTGVFGDVWFYPDSSGGRVVFDRDSRVSSWTVP